MKKKVCIIIPAYNEASVISSVVKNTHNVFQKSLYQVDVIMINDHSSDNTAALAQRAGASVISHIINTGAGGATATGLGYALRHNYDIAATMDADGQHDPSDVLRGIKEIEKQGVDLLIGSRLMNRQEMSFLKTLGNKGLSIITYLLFGIYMTDSQSGLRVYSRKALEQLRWKTSGYEFCSEMIWRAKQQGLRLGEYPIRTIYTDYSKAKGQNNWNGVNILKSLVKRRIAELFE